MKKIVPLLTIALLNIFPFGLAKANSIENLERERALTVETLLDPTIDSENRWKKTSQSKRRLADLEVMVINDKSLASNISLRVKNTLKNYELTFLAHASTEKDKALAVHWFEEIGLTTDQIMAARVSK